MQPAPYHEALDAYANPFHDFSVEPVKGGLINQTYKVTSKISGESFLLQQINQQVFSEPAAVQANYEKLWKWLRSEEIHFTMPEPKYFLGDASFFCDARNNYWRVFEFIYGAQTFLISENPAQARAVARVFGGFTTVFDQFDIDRLQVVIPHFHDLSFRFRQFKKAIHGGHFDRLRNASTLIKELKERERYCSLYDIMTESPAFPRRVIHHDAKIGNVLFDEDTGQVICPVDFDTTMPGYFFSDLGDMIRSMSCSHDENSTDFPGLHIREDFYEAIIEGYLEEMEERLTKAEKKFIHHAGLFMTCMQALRFLTDYLDGDIYYKVNYPEQNFDRAKNQLILLQELEKFLSTRHNYKV